MYSIRLYVTMLKSAYEKSDFVPVPSFPPLENNNRQNIDEKVVSTTFQLYRGGPFICEETGVPAEHHRPDASHCQTLLHNVVSSTPRHGRNSNSQPWL